jgi:hypothetical protein
MKDWILLDSQSTVNLFCNSAFVHNITKGNEKLILTTNTGNLLTNTMAIVPGFRKVWYEKEAKTNVFSLANMEKQYQITYDSKKESVFVVLTENGPLKFTKGPENLYKCKPRHITQNMNTTMVMTVDESKRFFTRRQVERAKKARTFLHTLGCPTIQDLKAIIWMNTIANCPVTITDVDLAQKIFGKRKTMQNKPTPVVHDFVEIDLCFNTIFINGMPLSTISKRMKYQTIEWVQEKTMDAYKVF